MAIRTALPALLLGLLLPSAGQAQSSDPAGSEVGAAAEAVSEALERALESRAKGPDSAAVVVFEIADFQCPYCARFAGEVAPRLDERYVEPGLIQWVFVNLPLHSHPLAWHAAEAALCAGAAGDAFWPMHDTLFARQDEWGASAEPHARFAAYAAELGVPADDFAACTAADQVAPLIVQDIGSAVSAGISGTPTFIITKDQEVVDRLVGVQPVEEWDRVLEAAGVKR